MANTVKSHTQEDLDKLHEVIKKQNPQMVADAGTTNTVQLLGVNVPNDWHSKASNIQPGQALPPWLWQVLIMALDMLRSMLNNPTPQPSPAPTPTPPAPIPGKP